jgi:K+/H+ antiporter YhaU regulatory subunit KhtT
MQNPQGRFVAKLPTVPVTAGFRLHLSGTAADLKDAERILGGELQIGSNLTGPLEAISKNEDVHMVEMIISADSEFIGRRIGDLRFTLRYGLELLGIHREHNQPSDPDIGNWVLHPGDLLLVQGASGRVEAAIQERDLLALDGKTSLPRTTKAPIAIGIMATVVVAAASGLMPIALAAILGAVAMLLTQCVLPRNLGKAVSAEVILLIPASLALG